MINSDDSLENWLLSEFSFCEWATMAIGSKCLSRKSETGEKNEDEICVIFILAKNIKL